MISPLFVLEIMAEASEWINPRTITLTTESKIPTPKLLKALEKLGPIIKFDLRRKDEKTASLMVTFKTPKTANEVPGINHVRNPRLQLTRNQSTQTTSRINQSVHNRLGPRTSLRIPQYEDEAYTRLFCQLPSHNKEATEERFLRHFSQFGDLIYHKIINDQYGQCKSGFVCYRRPEHAERALQNCDPRYRASPAKPRKMSLQDRNEPDHKRQTLHDVCGKQVERSIYHLHEDTCRRLRIYRHIGERSKQEPTSSIYVPARYQEITFGPRKSKIE